MFVTDPIADFLTRIRNATAARHKYVDVNWSKMNQSIAQVMQESGFIEQFLVRSEGGISTMRVYLRYTRGRASVIRGLKRVSTPGRRYYVGYEDMPSVFNGLGISIVTTSQGVLSGQEARRRKVGGELLCFVW